jgi:uncharacterized protein
MQVRRTCRDFGNKADDVPYVRKSTEHWLHASYDRNDEFIDYWRMAMVQTHSYRIPASAICFAACALVLMVMMAPRIARAADETIPRLQAAADKGFVPQEIELAAAYFTGSGVMQDLKTAAYWYEKAAESGDPEAENEIGFLYQTGTGVPADQARAFHWYQLSAASGYVKAKVNLGVMYVWGIAVRKNEEMGAQFFREAAASGSGAAAGYLGDMCYFGIGMRQDKAAAENWYAIGAKLHDPVAAYNLASLFSVEAGHPHDLPKAQGLLREAVSAGYVPAMHSLGLLLVNHPQLARTAQEPRMLLEDASAAGSWRSTVLLGVLARDGNGVIAPEPETAYYEFQVAILQGGEEAKRLLANDIIVLSQKVSVKRAEELAANAGAWYRQHPTALSFVYKKDGNFKRFPALARAVADQSVHAGQLIPPPPA